MQECCVYLVLILGRNPLHEGGNRRSSGGKQVRFTRRLVVSMLSRM